jgi:hypothetical protein
MRIKGLDGEQYFMLLIDDYTIMTLGFLPQEKFRSFRMFHGIQGTG